MLHSGEARQNRPALRAQPRYLVPFLRRHHSAPVTSWATRRQQIARPPRPGLRAPLPFAPRRAGPRPAHRGGALFDRLLRVLHLEEVAVGREDGDGAVVTHHCGRASSGRRRSKAHTHRQRPALPFLPKTQYCRDTCSSLCPIHWQHPFLSTPPQNPACSSGIISFVPRTWCLGVFCANSKNFYIAAMPQMGLHDPPTPILTLPRASSFCSLHPAVAN